MEGRAGCGDGFVNVLFAALGDGEDGFAIGGVFDGKGAVGGGRVEFVVDKEAGGEGDGAVVDCDGGGGGVAGLEAEGLFDMF